MKGAMRYCVHDSRGPKEMSQAPLQSLEVSAFCGFFYNMSWVSSGDLLWQKAY